MGHPDKLCDQISDAILDSLLEHDPNVRAAIETLVTTGLVVVAGEVTVHNAEADRVLGRAEETVRETIRKIGYDDADSGFDYRSCEVMCRLHAQSDDIALGVDRDGAGDQGLMFGFACNETEALMPLPIQLSHRLMEKLAEIRQAGGIKWLRPDSKTQVTVLYEEGMPKAIDGIVLSTQHTEEAVDPGTGVMSDQAAKEIIEKVIRPVVCRENEQLWSDAIHFHINPTGRFVIGGPHGDSGLTGRKIIVDTYGGRGRHGGGAFSGKDPSKVDRSAAYMARYIAKNVVAAKLAKLCEVQLAYAIGVPKPVSVLVDTCGTGQIPDAKLEGIIREIFPLTPRAIIQHLDLRRPIYTETARHGHFGRDLPTFTWEKTDKVEELRKKALG